MVALLSSSAYSVKSQVNSIAQAELPSQDRQRIQEMARAWQAYKGKLPDPLKVEMNQPNDNVKSNRCEPIVNKGASALFGEVVKIEACDETPEPDTKIQDFIEGLWGDDDERMTKLNKVAVNGGVFGQAFLKLIPAQGNMKYPRIVNLNPQIVRIVTSPEDCDLHVAYIIETPGASGFQKRQVIARVDPDNSAPIVGEDDLQDYWTITNYVRMDQAGMWQQSGPVDLWDYPFAPIFCCQNLPNPNEAWGAPDLTPDLIQLNEALNFLLSSLARITKYHGHPITYATGTYASEIDMSINGLTCLPTKESTFGKLDPMTDFSGLLSFIEDIRSSMDEQSRIPAVALGRLKDAIKGNISGIALKLMFMPLLEKSMLKRRLYGHLIKSVTRAALVINEDIPIEDYNTHPLELHWQQLIPTDDLQDAQEALILQQLGIASKATIAARLGFDYEVENEKKTKEDEQATTNYNQGVGLAPAQQPVMQAQPVAPGQQGQEIAA